MAVENADKSALGLPAFDIRAEPGRHLDDIDVMTSYTAGLHIDIAQFAALGGKHDDQPIVGETRAGLVVACHVHGTV